MNIHMNTHFVVCNSEQSIRRKADFKSAQSFLEKALDIHQKSLSSDHSNLIEVYSNLGETYQMLSQLIIILV